MIGSNAVVSRLTPAADLGHNIRGDRHPGTGDHCNRHNISTDRNRQVHAIPRERKGDHSNDHKATPTAPTFTPAPQTPPDTASHSRATRPARHRTRYGRGVSRGDRPALERRAVTSRSRRTRSIISSGR